MGGVLPSDQVEPAMSRMLAVNQLKNRLESTRWSQKEYLAFRAAGLHEMSDEDFSAQFAPLADYYAAPIASLRTFWGANDGQDFRRRDLVTLLNNWPGELDRARGYQLWVAEKKESDDSGRLTNDWDRPPPIFN
jgi:hypothetical protein